LKVIAVPFIEGSHCPQSKEQLLGVANYLKKMHDVGFVHGDIRLLNIVFTEKADDSQFIDFDFGGKVDDNSPVYPPGYNEILRDRERIGIANEPIKKWHDVYALYQAFDKVLFNPGADWDMLQFTSMADLSIDDLIKAVEALVIRGDGSIGVPFTLIPLLENNTKLGTRSIA
jgi:serine/threonine protein kinase